MNTTQTENKKVGLYFILVYAFSWPLWIPFVLDGLGIISLPSMGLIFTQIPLMVGAFAPLFSAIALTVGRYGWKGVWQLIKRGFDIRVKWTYVLLALGLPVAITAAAHYLTILTGLQALPSIFLPDEVPLPPLVVAIPYFFVILFIGGGHEEFGWRGYAQEPLQERFGITKSSLIIGFFWGLWHLPLWFFAEDTHSQLPFVGFWLFATFVSVQYGWLHNASGKKLSIAWLYHAMSNTIPMLFPHFVNEAGVVQLGYWVFVGINVIVSLGMIVWLIRPMEKAATIKAEPNSDVTTGERTLAPAVQSGLTR